MLASVQKYVHGIADGLAMPAGVPGPLVARITPPMWERVSAPHAYVWGGRVRGDRQTAPRGKGFRRIPWVVDLYLTYMDTPDDALANEPFPTVVDAVLSAFFTTTMPLFISATGVPAGPNATSATDTQILAIGESFDMDYPPERSVTAGRTIWYSTRIGLDVLEVVQG